MPLVLVDVGEPDARFSVIRFLETEEKEKMLLELLANSSAVSQPEIISILDHQFFSQTPEETKAVQEFNEIIAASSPEVRKNFEVFLTVIFQYAESIGFTTGQNCLILNRSDN